MSLKIFNLMGEEIATLANERRAAGNYSVIFDANGLSSGFYLYRLTAGNFNETKCMLLVK